MHLPTNVDIIVEYINDAMAKTHILKSIKQRYKPSRKPHNDSVIAR